MLRVCVVPVEEKEISFPPVPTVKNCDTPVKPLSDVMPAPAIPRALQLVPS